MAAPTPETLSLGGLQRVASRVRLAHARAAERGAGAWLAAAVAPLLLPLLMVWVSDGVPPWRILAVPGAAPQLETPLPGAAVRTEAEIAELRDVLARPCPADDACGPAEAAARIALRERLTALATPPDGATDAVRRHAATRAEILFAGALALAATLAILATAAHLALARRFGDAIALAGGGRAASGVGFAAGAGVILGLAGLGSLAALEAPWDPWERAVWLAVLGVGLAVSAALAASVALTHLFARSYPDPSDASGIQKVIDEARPVIRAVPACRPTPNGQKPGDDDVVVRVGTLRLWDRLLIATDAEALAPGTPVATSASLAPSQILDAVGKVALTAALVAVAWLTALALGLDLLAARSGARGEVAEAMARTHGAWLVVLGLGYSAVLAVVYVRPAIRLAPFREGEAEVDAEDARPTVPAEVGWTKVTRIDGLGWQTVESRTRAARSESADRADAVWAERAAAADRRLTSGLGCDARKLRIIRQSARKAGGFHEVMKSGGVRWAGQILTLLAPALASGLLSVLV